MLGGNVLLLILALTIYMAPAWTLTLKDAFYWAVVVLVIAMRYVDITRFGGQTAYGEPATRRVWVKYAVGMAVVSAAIWAIAQSTQAFA